MRCDLVNCMPYDSRPHVETGPPSSTLENNKVSLWPGKTVRPLVLLLRAPNDATRNIRLGSHVIVVSTALQII